MGSELGFYSIFHETEKLCIDWIRGRREHKGAGGHYWKYWGTPNTWGQLEGCFMHHKSIKSLSFILHVVENFKTTILYLGDKQTRF